MRPETDFLQILGFGKIEVKSQKSKKKLNDCQLNLKKSQMGLSYVALNFFKEAAKMSLELLGPLLELLLLLLLLLLHVLITEF